MGKDRDFEAGPKLPEPIRIAIGSMGYIYNTLFWDTETGQPGAFLRLIMRKELENNGQIPPKSDETDE